MTINKALARVKALYEPTYSDDILVDWLWEMDQRLLREEFLRQIPIDPYDAATDGDVTLLIPAPWDRLYILYLTRMIHYHRGEYEEAAVFENEYNDLLAEYMANLLNRLPRGPFGEPWLEMSLTLRAGRYFSAELGPIPPDAAGVTVKLAKAGTRVDTWVLDTDEELDLVNGLLVLTLDAEYTDDLAAGGYEIYVTVSTDERGSADAMPVPLRVLPAYELEEET